MAAHAGAAAALHRRPARAQHARSISRSRSPRWKAHWDGSKPGDFHIFAWPDEKAETQPLRDLDPARRLADPHARSERAVPRPEERAAAASVRRCMPVFFAFRIMVGIGFLMIAAGAVRRVAVVARHAVRRRAGILRIVRIRWWIGFVAVHRRLDRHRERPPAVDRARHPAHRRRDLAGAGRQRRC